MILNNGTKAGVTVKKWLNNEKGYSVIEITFVMILLAIFGFTTFTLVAVGANSYETMLYEREGHAKMRVALSYISTRVRQGDAENALRIAEVEGNKALVLTQNENGETYETWIYMRDRDLCEIFIPQGVSFGAADGVTLVDVNGIDMVLDETGQGVNITVLSSNPMKYPDLSVYIQLRSAS